MNKITKTNVHKAIEIGTYGTIRSVVLNKTWMGEKTEIKLKPSVEVFYDGQDEHGFYVVFDSDEDAEQMYWQLLVAASKRGDLQGKGHIRFR